MSGIPGQSAIPTPPLASSGAIESPLTSAGYDRAAPSVSLHRAPRIMIVDDITLNIKVAQAHLTAAGYQDFIPVTDAKNAVAAVQRDKPDVVLLDLMMPDVSGLEILSEINEQARCAQLPVIVLTGSESRDLRRKALKLGAFDFLAKPVDSEELVLRVGNALHLKNHHDEMEHAVRARTAELEQSREEIIRCLAKAADYRKKESDRHIVRVSQYATATAQAMGLEPTFIRLLGQAAMLHDVGKLALPDALLENRALQPEEYELLSQHLPAACCDLESMSDEDFRSFTTHASLGSSILSECSSDLMRLAGRIALTHHEWWDGSGYPLGLAGEDIPIEGRITAIADTFDSLSSKSKYKAAIPQAECFELMEVRRGTQFDPVALDAFFQCRTQIAAIQIAYADTE